MPKEDQVVLKSTSQGTVDRGNGGLQPYQLDAELAQLKMAELMVQKLGTPSRLSKPFIVRYAIFKALNHVEPTYGKIITDEYTDGFGIWHPADRVVLDPGNPTGFDCTLRLKFYENFAKESVNENGLYLQSFWAFMMKPKYIINGALQTGAIQEEEKESLVGRFMNWIRGKPKEPKPGQVQQ
jgi:hypothetical protein